MVHVGVDLHKGISQIAVLTAEGKLRWGQEGQREEKNLTRPTRLEMLPSLLIAASLFGLLRPEVRDFLKALTDLLKAVGDFILK